MDCRVVEMCGMWDVVEIMRECVWVVLDAWRRGLGIHVATQTLCWV